MHSRALALKQYEPSKNKRLTCLRCNCLYLERHADKVAHRVTRGELDESDDSDGNQGTPPQRSSYATLLESLNCSTCPMSAHGWCI